MRRRRRDPPPPSKSAPPNADYAGRTDDNSSAVAVSLRGGKAIAYFCDGRSKESWLKGDVKDNGTMKLTGKNGAELNGTLKDGRSIRGTVDLGRQRYAFTADKAVKPSGLYRATATVRGASSTAAGSCCPAASRSASSTGTASPRRRRRSTLGPAP